MPEPGVRLILNDGTVIEEGRAGYYNGHLWLRLPGWTMQQAAELAFNAIATQKIIFQYGEEEEVYNGYTVCIDIKLDDQEISVCMVKG